MEKGKLLKVKHFLIVFLYIRHTLEKVKLRSAKRFVTGTRNLKIKMPSVYGLEKSS